jgi:hypothetical protein
MPVHGFFWPIDAANRTAIRSLADMGSKRVIA